jgi:hypothetical protein
LGISKHPIGTWNHQSNNVAGDIVSTPWPDLRYETHHLLDLAVFALSSHDQHIT